MHLWSLFFDVFFFCVMWFEFWFFSNEKMKLFFSVLPILSLSFFSDLKHFKALKSCCRPIPCLSLFSCLYGLFLPFWQRLTSQASLFFSNEKMKLFFSVLPILSLSFFSDLKHFKALKSCCRPIPCLSLFSCLYGLFLPSCRCFTFQPFPFSFSIEKNFFWFLIFCFSDLLSKHSQAF